MKHAALGLSAVTAFTLSAHAGAPVEWATPVNGIWSNAVNWDPAVIPGLSDSVFLGLTGPYTVSVINQDAAAGDLIITNPDAVVGITVARTLRIGATLSNNGAVVVNPADTNNFTTLLMDDGSSVTGNGRITLNGADFRARIFPASAGAAFTHGDGHTIDGRGRIDTGMTNNGLVSAGVAGGAMILASNPKANNNRMQAVNGASLVFSGQTITQSPSATIAADGADSTVVLSGVIINGGSIETTNGGLVFVMNADAVINDLNLAADSQITVTRALTATGNIVHTGHMVINPTGENNFTTLLMADGVNLTGDGRITLNAFDIRARIFPATTGAGFTHAAGHTIDGQGRIDAGMTNNGLVKADVAGGVMTLASNPKTNNNRMEAVNGGSLVFSGQTITQSPSATIAAGGADSTVVLSGVTVNGGSIETTSGGLVSVTADAAINDLNLAGDSQITVARTLTATGDIAHTGHMVINPNAENNFTTLLMTDGVNLTGNGRITLNAADFRARIFPASAGAVFTHAAGHTIDGQGRIDAGMTNNGLVSADVAGGAMILASNPKANNNRMQAVNGASLVFTGQTITQSSTATIAADGVGSTVVLSGVTVNGGSIETANGGLVSVINADADISNLELAADSQITVARALTATGDIVHNGHMVINPAAGNNFTTLLMADGVNLTGNGRITLNAADFRARIIPATGGAAFTLGSGQRLDGIGAINAAMTLEGVLAPGLSVGTMSATQPITLTPSSTMEIEVSGQNDADRLASTSTFQADGTLEVALVDAFNPPSAWSATIVTTSPTGVSGTFHTVNAPQPTDPRLGFRVVYEPSQIRIGAFCKADTNADNLLNFFDVTTFIAAFNAGDPDADIAVPFGTLNFFDLLGYIARFNTGCP